MSTTALIILIGVIVIVAIAAWTFLEKRRTTTLRSRFGPEYDHTVREYGNRTKAEKALEKRTERAERYHIRPLNESEQHRFMEEWRHTQARFVDNPALAIQEADHLVGEADALAPGDYVLHWQVLAVDGHITRGDIPFSVAAH